MPCQPVGGDVRFLAKEVAAGCVPVDGEVVAVGAELEELEKGVAAGDCVTVQGGGGGEVVAVVAEPFCWSCLALANSKFNSACANFNFN